VAALLPDVDDGGQRGDDNNGDHDGEEVPFQLLLGDDGYVRFSCDNRYRVRTLLLMVALTS
jgi:hypothetical protein